MEKTTTNKNIYIKTDDNKVINENDKLKIKNKIEELQKIIEKNNKEEKETKTYKDKIAENIRTANNNIELFKEINISINELTNYINNIINENNNKFTQIKNDINRILQDAITSAYTNFYNALNEFNVVNDNINNKINNKINALNDETYKNSNIEKKRSFLYLNAAELKL